MQATGGSLREPPNFEGDDRFEIRSTLGRGTSSVVYRAFDRQQTSEVALKVLSLPDAAGMLAFKREFRSMADLAHPNLVKLYELHRAGEGLMFTMELVDGNDFLGFVRRPTGAAPVWDGGTPRPDVGERDTVAEWRDGAPDRVPIGLMGELAYFPPLAADQIPTLRTITAQLVRGLMALHEAGHVHRDVKPSNVLVDDRGRAVLLDFGVAAELAGPAAAAGTPAYMSPEQAQGERPSPSADFYAVGVMLYEALTGRLPYTSHDPVRDKLLRDPGPPSSVVPQVPIDLDRLCMALLARDPALRPHGPAILDLLCGDSERTLPPPARTEVPFIGRTAELRRIEEAMHEVVGGQGRVVLVKGRSGIGKSALIRHFLGRQRRSGAVVLTGRCYEQESVPFKALDAVMDAMCQHLATMSAAEREEVMPRHRWALGRLFPVLAQFEAAAASGQTPPRDPTRTLADLPPEAAGHATVRVTDPRSDRHPTEPPATDSVPDLGRAEAFVAAFNARSTRSNLFDSVDASRSTVVVGAPSVAEPGQAPVAVDPARVRRQGIVALGQLFSALARNAPLIVAIDDLQWGDVDSAQVLAEVLGSPMPPLLLIGSFREEDEYTSDFLRRFLPAQPDHEIIPLAPLEDQAALSLARSLVAVPGSTGASSVAAEAKGDPFLLVELARHVASEAGIVASARDLTMESVVRTRIAGLDGPARRLLEVIAVAAGPVPRVVARHAAQIGGQDSRAMVQLRAANLMRVKGTRGIEVIETYHDRIRDAVIEQLGDDARIKWHLRLVEAMRAEGHMDHERIGRHLERGGRGTQAIPHYLLAAEAATRTLAFDRAAELYSRALAGGEFNVTQEVQIRTDYAEVLVRQARYDEAAGELHRARERLGPSEQRARVYHMLGEVELSRGDVVAGAEALEQALCDLGQPVPSNRRTLLTSNLREAAVQLRNTYLPSRAPLPRPPKESELLALRVYSRLTYAYYFSRSSVQAFWPHLRELNAAERHPPTPELGRAYAGHGMMLTVVPWFRRGLTYVERGLAVQRDVGDRFGEAQALHQQGVVLYSASRFAEAARVSMVAAERLEAQGDAPQAHDALLHAAMAMHQLGRSAAATGIARRVHEEALDSGDMFAAGKSLLVWTTASGGRVPSMMIRVQLEIAERIDHRYTKLLGMQANGLRLLGARRAAEAARVLDQTAAERKAYGLSTTELLSELDVWRTTAWRRAAEQARSPREHRQALTTARRRLRIALWTTARFRNGLAHALREGGRIALLRGARLRARALLDASLAIALRHEQKEQQAMTLLVRGHHFGAQDSAAAAEAKRVREQPRVYEAARRLEGPK